MKSFLLIIFYVFILNCSNLAQYPFNEELIRPEIKSIVELLLTGYVSSKYVGLEENPSKDFHRFEQLRDNATTDELIELTNHPNGIIRCYAFLGILFKDTSEVSVKIYRNHLVDFKKVPSSFGCRIGEIQVNEFYNIAVVCAMDSGYVKKFTKKDFEYIHKKLPESNYESIRRNALNDSIYDAYVVLAKYQKQQDIESIKRLFGNDKTIIWGLRSVVYFPDTAFLPILKQLPRQYFKRNFDTEYLYDLYYKALVQYHCNWIRNKVKNDIRKKNIRKSIVAALQRFPESEYTYQNGKRIKKELYEMKPDEIISRMYLD